MQEISIGKRIQQEARFPFHGWLGLLLVAIFWSLNWGLSGLRTQWGFTGLWLGYFLTVDGLVFWRKGDSILTRNGITTGWLFLVSVTAWWMFELINWRTQNWMYDGKQYFTNLEYFMLASFGFSTVMPAVFSTAELYGTFTWLQKVRPGLVIRPTHANLRRFFLSGLVMLGLLVFWPRYFFPLVWVSLYFIFEPLNAWLGRRTLAEHTERGDWRPVYALWLGGLTCGFFWEMWNYWSYPKWIYHVPFVGFWKVFEMPLLGYGGYLPFALELYAFFNLAAGIFRLPNIQHFVRLIPEEK
jgi:hypothetical protein